MVYSEAEKFGPFRSAMIRFVESLLKMKKITVYSDSSRSWLYISDAVKIFERCLGVDNFDIINIAHPESVSTYYVASRICEKLGLNPADYIREEKTPHMMTVNKNIDTSRMIISTGISPEVSIEQGIDIIINGVKKRLQYE
jgi:nucleoside-diphosphate-sugar epimerase